uniref:Aspartate aminotransferase family protein n=1 Tax=Ignisphaera aggregans TaxID=334771 RepID=A0A7C2ZMQ1_9CREN
MGIAKSLDSRVEELLPRIVSTYVNKTKKSAEMFSRAFRVLPGGVTYHIRYIDPHPIYVARAKKARIWDVDGNEYIDFWMGHGAHILGHAPDIVIEAVNRVSREGTHLGFENPYAVEYAELLTKVIPGADMVRFCNSGTEANMYAVRLARAYTKKRYVVKIEGGWHGSLDQLHVAITPPFVGPESLGIPEDFVKYTVAVPYNDVDSIERVLKGLDVAAILMEPVPGSGGCIEPEDGYLREVRRLADAYGALLIFDEVITGFRLALGGAQEYFNVRSDIVVLGKIVGGGYPGAGAFAGKREYMELLDQLKYPGTRQRVFHGGTFTGNPVTMVAGYTTIKYLHDNRHLYNEFNNRWSRAAKELDRVCEEHDRICWVTSVGSMIGIHFTSKKPKNIGEAYTSRLSEKVYKALHLYMVNGGIVFMSWKMPHLMPSMVHGEDDAESLVKTFSEFLDILAFLPSRYF